jgi:hypothetical protein
MSGSTSRYSVTPAVGPSPRQSWRPSGQQYTHRGQSLPSTHDSSESARLRCNDWKASDVPQRHPELVNRSRSCFHLQPLQSDRRLASRARAQRLTSTPMMRVDRSSARTNSTKRRRDRRTPRSLARSEPLASSWSPATVDMSKTRRRHSPPAECAIEETPLTPAGRPTLRTQWISAARR